MKTLAVLSALVAVALAAPAPLEEGSENFKNVITNVPETFKRERKSAQDSSQSNNPMPGSQANLLSPSQISEFGVSGRSFGLTKPIIIKKKLGYHVYRDSDEEQAESSETCGKQVKVKLCDVKSEEKMKSVPVEDINTQMTEDDMKRSIKLAKEAVENLQRDLMIVDHKPGSEVTQNHMHSASDSELHQDIEVAREALEHIHNNFGNLESMSLHATTLSDADAVQDAHFAIAKTEEQRLAQWKEAINTIQKNVEIAKNIENSFKDSSGETGLLFTDDNTKNEPNKAINHKMKATENMDIKDENKFDSENCKNEPMHEKLEKDNVKTGSIKEDMAASASTVSEKKENFHNLEKLRQLPVTKDNNALLKLDKILENHSMTKDADMEPMTSLDLFQKNSLASDSMKIKEENKERRNELQQNDKKLELTGITNSLPASTTSQMKSVEPEDILVENKRSAPVIDKIQSQKSLMHDENMEKTEKADQNRQMKSVEHIKQSSVNFQEDNKTHDKGQATEVDKTMMILKSAEEVPVNAQKELLSDTKNQVNTAHMHNLQPHSTQPKMTKHENMKQQNAVMPPQMQFHQHNPEMRRIDDFNSMHQHQLLDPLQTRWAEDKNFRSQMELMKSVDDTHSQSMDHVHTIQHPGHHHHLAHTGNTQNGHGQLQSRFHDSFMTQGKSADAEMQSHYMNMRDGSVPDNQRFLWKPAHESSRNTFTAPVAVSSSSGGALGLFPNANIGSCGIPLLLSCNPSVVSGSLAKAHPAPFTAPAFRTEDEFKFQTKRDVKKTHEHLPSPMQKTPTNVNLKSSNVLVAKQ